MPAVRSPGIQFRRSKNLGVTAIRLVWWLLRKKPKNNSVGSRSSRISKRSSGAPGDGTPPIRTVIQTSVLSPKYLLFRGQDTRRDARARIWRFAHERTKKNP